MQSRRASGAGFTRTNSVFPGFLMGIAVQTLWVGTVASPGVIPDPDWTAFPLFEEQVEIAVKERLIDTPDHLVMRKLRGEA